MSVQQVTGKVGQREEIFPVQSIHHVELFVGNAKQTAYYFAKPLVFK